ncbi:MAG: glycosyltransferase family 2 protein [Candidatus Levybacteria bacterium]|nr:glycosyltransferase family 2 protein [Candidatus Levybacteria bacterium]
MIELSIIILSYNTKDLTRRCIQSVRKQYKKELIDKKLEIIVIDNNSSDDSASLLSDLKKEILASRRSGSNFTLIQNRENLGFAKGCNFGAKNAKGKYLLFLNSDTTVLDRGFLRMTEFLDNHKEAGILGGRLLNPNGTPQRSGGKFYNLWYLFLMLLGLEVLVRRSPTKIDKIDWVSGACLMIGKNQFNNLSGFDEHFFMYIEDMELCYRMRKLGFSTYFYPFVGIEHKTLGSSNRSFAIINIYKGILYFYSKHKNHLEYLVAKTLLISKAEILILVGFLTFSSGLRDRYRKAVMF